MKELTINKNTNINKIKNKEEYEKLIIKYKINPKKLEGFKNIKELIIERYNNGFNVYNEININKLPFKENITKLSFINVGNFGRVKDLTKVYKINFTNLKTINFLGNFFSINKNYLRNCENLETIMFEPNKIYNYLTLELDSCNSHLKKIIILKDNKEYEVKINYNPYDYLLKNNNHEYILEYNNNNIQTKVKIENENIIEYNYLKFINDDLIKEKIFFIPNYISFINVTNTYIKKDFNCISLNLYLLKNQIEKTLLIDALYIKQLKKIIIRSNNEMSLFESSEIVLEEDLKEIYIENKTLNIVYPNKVIIIDEFGKKTIKEYVVKNYKEHIEDLFNKYNIDEIKEYLYYKELLELVKKYNDEEIDNAMELVGEKLIKRLIK